MEYKAFINDTVLIATPVLEPLKNVLLATLLLVLVLFLLILELHRVFVLLKFRKDLKADGFQIVRLSSD